MPFRYTISSKTWKEKQFAKKCICYGLVFGIFLGSIFWFSGFNKHVPKEDSELWTPGSIQQFLPCLFILGLIFCSTMISMGIGVLLEDFTIRHGCEVDFSIVFHVYAGLGLIVSFVLAIHYIFLIICVILRHLF